MGVLGLFPLRICWRHITSLGPLCTSNSHPVSLVTIVDERLAVGRGRARRKLCFSSRSRGDEPGAMGRVEF